MDVSYMPSPVMYAAKLGSAFHVSVLIGGREVRALLDSGCKQSVVQKHLVLPSQYLPGSLVHIRCVHGDVKAYPLANIMIVPLGSQALTVQVGVVETLPEDLILGIDNPRFLALFGSIMKEGREKPAGHHTPPILVSPEPWVIDKGFHFAQGNDPTLLNAWEAAHISTTSTQPRYPRFVIKDHLLYRQASEDEPLQLLVPQSFRKQVLYFSHSHLTAGHVGAEKNTQNILRHFFWPGIYAEIKEYCLSCKICQKRNMTKPYAVPLQPKPIIGKPFERVGMDLIWPLPRTQRGNEYVLVIVDYATRVPEAFPLKTTTTKQIAEKFIELFARVGFPTEILTDQGTPFVSRLMKEVCSSLDIHQLRTSVYHPQTDGLVERYNKTLKTTLKKMLEVEGREWDRLLPLALYVIRAQVQSSLGCSSLSYYMADNQGPCWRLQKTCGRNKTKKKQRSCWNIR